MAQQMPPQSVLSPQSVALRRQLQVIHAPFLQSHALYGHLQRTDNAVSAHYAGCGRRGTAAGGDPCKIRCIACHLFCNARRLQSVDIRILLSQGMELTSEPAAATPLPTSLAGIRHAMSSLGATRDERGGGSGTFKVVHAIPVVRGVAMLNVLNSSVLIGDWIAPKPGPETPGFDWNATPRSATSSWDHSGVPSPFPPASGTWITRVSCRIMHLLEFNVLVGSATRCHAACAVAATARQQTPARVLRRW